MDVQLGNAGNLTRQQPVNKCMESGIKATAPLTPSSSIAHFQGLPPARLEAWIANLELSIRQMLDQGVSAILSVR